MLPVFAFFDIYYPPWWRCPRLDLPREDSSSRMGFVLLSLRQTSARSICSLLHGKSRCRHILIITNPNSYLWLGCRTHKRSSSYRNAIIRAQSEDDPGSFFMSHSAVDLQLISETIPIKDQQRPLSSSESPHSRQSQTLARIHCKPYCPIPIRFTDACGVCRCHCRKHLLEPLNHTQSIYRNKVHTIFK